MKNSESNQYFFIVSDEDEYTQEDGDEYQNDSDITNSDEDEDDHSQRKPSSLNPSWPHSYRQSIDLYSSVVSSPGAFLGTPVLTRLGSSFLVSSLTRRHTPADLPTLHKPLLPPQVEDDQVSKQKRSYSCLFPPPPSRKSSQVATKQKISHELSMSHQSLYGQAVFNGRLNS